MIIMKSMKKYILPLFLSFSILAMAGCETAGPAGSSASRLDSALERAIQEAEKSGTPAEKIMVLEQIYKRNADDPVVAARFAKVLREDDQITKARMVLAPFTEEGNKHPEALTEMAKIHLNLGEYGEAENYARQSIQIEPRQGHAYLALGAALDAQGFHEKAETAFRNGLEYWKGDPAPILNNLALNLASQGHLYESVSILQRAKEVAPHRMEIERNLRIISALIETSGPKAPKPPRKPDNIGAAG